MERVFLYEKSSDGELSRKRGRYYVGRTQYDSPDVDNEVLIEAKSNFLRVGQFVNAKIIDASDFDLYAEV